MLTKETVQSSQRKISQGSAYSPHSLSDALQGWNSVSTVPWGTGKRASLLRERSERFWRKGRYCVSSTIHTASPLAEGRTPRLLSGGVSADLSFTDARNLLPDAADPLIEWLLIDAEAIVDIDVTATEAISSLQRELGRKGIMLAIARANHPLQNMLERAGLTERIGVQHFYPTVRTGVQAYLAQRTKE